MKALTYAALISAAVTMFPTSSRSYDKTTPHQLLRLVGPADPRIPSVTGPASRSAGVLRYEPPPLVGPSIPSVTDDEDDDDDEDADE